MAEFFNVLAPGDALEALKGMVAPIAAQEGGCEVVATVGALGRVAAGDVGAAEELPSFARATMDGYSVRARDTFGASEGLPAYLEVVGEVRMGRAADVGLGVGEAAVAHTGGMLAQGADAVVQVERTQRLDDATIEVLRAVAPGENVAQVGEDVRGGDAVLAKGSVIRAQDVGGLLALGITEVRVSRMPRVGIVSSGDELVPPDSKPGPGQIRDINTYTIAALVRQAGGDAVAVALARDDYESQRAAAMRGLAECDMLVFSAGSSVSSRDMTAEVIAGLGEPGVVAHGISIKPGKPTIIGAAKGKPIIGLPGNPVSAMVVFDLIGRPAIYHLSGCERAPMRGVAQARLARDVPSAAGREDYVPVRLTAAADGGLMAEPVFGKSGLIYTLARSDGLVKVGLDKGGLYAGESVGVRLYWG